MYCSKCNEEITIVNAKFCKKCGEPIIYDQLTNEDLSVQSEKEIEEYSINEGLKKKDELPKQDFQGEKETKVKKSGLLYRIKTVFRSKENKDVHEKNFDKNKYLLIILIQIIMFILYGISAMYMFRFEKIILSPILYLGSLWFILSTLNVVILLAILKINEKYKQFND